jgi:MFS family permease
MLRGERAEESPAAGVEWRRGAVLAVAALGTALAYMSDDMLNLAIPSVAHDLQASTTAVQWILNAYYVPLVAFVLVAGSLGDVVGHRRVFTAGLLLFGSAAVLCAAAPDIALLIAGRALQGVAAAMLLAAGLALVTIANPGERRDRAVGSSWLRRPRCRPWGRSSAARWSTGCRGGGCSSSHLYSPSAPWRSPGPYPKRGTTPCTAPPRCSSCS